MSIEGFFQSEKFFKEYRTEILELFQPSKEILNQLEHRYPQILSHEKSVAVHVRMYKDTTPDFHPFVKWDYILKGMELFEPESLFVIFSDQIELTKKNSDQTLP